MCHSNHFRRIFLSLSCLEWNNHSASASIVFLPSIEAFMYSEREINWTLSRNCVALSLISCQIYQARTWWLVATKRTEATDRESGVRLLPKRIHRHRQFRKRPPSHLDHSRSHPHRQKWPTPYVHVCTQISGNFTYIVKPSALSKPRFI